jgi:hypothetical protein
LDSSTFKLRFRAFVAFAGSLSFEGARLAGALALTVSTGLGVVALAGMYWVILVSLLLINSIQNILKYH